MSNQEFTVKFAIEKVISVKATDEWKARKQAMEELKKCLEIA